MSALSPPTTRLFDAAIVEPIKDEALSSMPF